MSSTRSTASATVAGLRSASARVSECWLLRDDSFFRCSAFRNFLRLLAFFGLIGIGVFLPRRSVDAAVFKTGANEDREVATRALGPLELLPDARRDVVVDIHGFAREFNLERLRGAVVAGGQDTTWLSNRLAVHC